MVIAPYQKGGAWVFDDEGRGLKAEALVAGIDTMLDTICQEEGLEPGRFGIAFSDAKFPGAQYRLDHTREEFGGNWYRSQEFGIEGWLCPALFLYFEEAPATIWTAIRRIG